ncbi:nucleotide-binding alpha-beta plait domain-containing protein [Artemisia annua]|uniref:Nucleotide-binding alpha-beta plait domain-containing protein n=1 Tax=Artemisia annua TaxID=35608 RepID=A0A2U1KQX6_ARTAN|nr:nucleotide-binding alpha-beta plait domain-containing protein [Artemisia annua]
MKKGHDKWSGDKEYIEDGIMQAVPSEHHNGVNRVNGRIQGSSGPRGRTKKIFVGGLTSTFTESDLKMRTKVLDLDPWEVDVLVFGGRGSEFAGNNTFGYSFEVRRL